MTINIDSIKICICFFNGQPFCQPLRCCDRRFYTLIYISTLLKEYIYIFLSHNQSLTATNITTNHFSTGAMTAKGKHSSFIWANVICISVVAVYFCNFLFEGKNVVMKLKDSALIDLPSQKLSNEVTPNNIYSRYIHCGTHFRESPGLVHISDSFFRHRSRRLGETESRNSSVHEKQ